MKPFTKLISLLFLCGISSLAFADLCDKDQDELAHCSYVNLADGVGKFIQFSTSEGPYQMAIGMCVNNRIEPVNIEKQHAYAPGNYSYVYTQCNNIECNIQKPLGVDNFTVNNDKSITPYKYAVNPDIAFGDSCNAMDTDLFTFARLKPSCDDANYCASATNPSTVNKIIKVVGSGMSMTYCGSNMHVAIHNDEDFANVAYSMKIFQCDNFQCANAKEIGKDIIKTNAKGEVDHASYSFTVDPSYGESCTPYPDNKKLSLIK